MLVWRICREKYVATALSGIGAEKFGGRWNRAGERMVYSSSTLSLAAFEVLVHTEPNTAPGDLCSVAVSVPSEASREELGPAELPPDWRDVSAPDALKELGSAWLREGRSLLLVVPSAVIPEERNVLINPSHPEAAGVRVLQFKPFAFDPRVWKR